MSNLKEVVHSSYKPLISIDNGLLDRKSYANTLFSTLCTTLMDKTTFALIQVFDLWNSIDKTITKIGSATLMRSLIQPLTSLELILEKQESVKEIEANKALRKSIMDYLGQVARIEGDLFRFLNSEMGRFGSLNHQFKEARKAGRCISDATRSIREPQTHYLRVLINDLKNYHGSEIYNLMKGTIYRTFRDVIAREDVHWKTFCRRYYSTPFTPWAPLPYLTMFFIIELMIKRLPGLITSTLGMSILFWVFADGMYRANAKSNVDYAHFMEPMRVKAVADEHFRNAIDAVGKLDELMSFITYKESKPCEMTLPKVTDSDKHYFVALHARNPVLLTRNPNVIANDIRLEGCRLTVLTGPNSGGKTTYCKTLAQLQVMSQIGSYIPASEAHISIADMIAYHAPMINSLQDEEGRFGTELARTKEIFISTTPRSLVILDELAEGTTFEEKIEQSYIILNGFYTIGNNTILVTHNHELATKMRNEGKGRYLKAEFTANEPTFRLIEGISTQSHADRIAKKLQFSREDIEKHLIERGYKK